MPLESIEDSAFPGVQRASGFRDLGFRVEGFGLRVSVSWPSYQLYLEMVVNCWSWWPKSRRNGYNHNLC